MKSTKHLGVNSESNGGGSSKRFEQIASSDGERNGARSYSETDDSFDDSEKGRKTRRNPSLQIKVAKQIPVPQVGSGLKRPLEIGSDGNPIIKKRQRLNKPQPKKLVAEEASWEGFSSDQRSDTDYSSSATSGTSLTETQTDSEKERDPLEPSSVDGDGSSVDEEGLENATAHEERSSAFKVWAAQQVNEALGFTPSANIVPVVQKAESELKQARPKPRPPEQEPLPPGLEAPGNHVERKAFNIPVERSPEMQEARLGLPIVAEEQKIMEAIYNNPVVIVWGATGSGKTTQIPQFLYEAGFGSAESPNPGIIGVTQPRRVAAVSMSKRVGDELGGLDGKVSYQIRFESSVSKKTAIKFMTDGILIREIAQDFALSKYSVIVIDEAHERSTNTDILIGMVSRIVDLRDSMSQDDPKIKPLKMVIMSANLRISDFLKNPNLFRRGPPPLLEAEGRQFPVTVHFARRTQRDYLEEAFQKVSQGHKKLPPGGMLVFLTSQNEITALAKRLVDAFVNTSDSRISTATVSMPATNVPQETEDLEVGQDSQENNLVGDESEGDDQAQENDNEKQFTIEDSTPASTSIHVLPLYSRLQTKDQLRVFEPPPSESRLIVLATNVAETSLTIPGIRYVFDCGRAKEKKFDRTTGVQSYEIGWISKASANQRTGRAGRTGPGHCYRLYSSAVYERDFEEHTKPEILRMPVEGVVLQLKSMDLQHVINFPFPTPPDRQSLAKAERLLSYIGAVSSEGKITSIGRELSLYPLSPRFSKILLIGHQHGCMPYAIAMVAALAVQDLLISESQLDLDTPADSRGDIYTHADQLADDAQERRRRSYYDAQLLFGKHSPTSDALKVLTALCAYAYAPDPLEFCTKMFLRAKALTEASRLRSQLSSVVQSNKPSLIGKYNSRLPEPSKVQLKALQQILAAAFIDQVAIRADLSPSPPDMSKKPRRVIDVPYYPLFPIHHGRVEELEEKAIYIHPSSVLVHLSQKDLPQYIIYSHLQRGTSATIEGSKKPKTRMHALTAVTGNQISGLAQGTPLLVFGKPIGKVEELEGGKRTCWVGVELIGEKGREGWPMAAKKVVQKRERGKWVVEQVVG